MHDAFILNVEIALDRQDVQIALDPQDVFVDAKIVDGWDVRIAQNLQDVKLHRRIGIIL